MIASSTPLAIRVNRDRAWADDPATSGEDGEAEPLWVGASEVPSEGDLLQQLEEVGG
jgi:hypothetical protein